MSLWLRTLLAGGVAPNGNRILQDSTVAEFFKPQTLVNRPSFYPTQQLTQPEWTTYGLGWFQHDYRGHKIDFHTGSIDGMVAIAGLIRELDLGVYVLGNRDHAELRHSIMYHVFDDYLGGEARDWNNDLYALYEGTPAPASEPPQAGNPSRGLEQYAGTYTDRLFGSVDVTAQDGALRLRYGPGLQGPMMPLGGDTLRVAWDADWRGSGRVVFSGGGTGAPDQLMLNGSTFTRSPDR